MTIARHNAGPRMSGAVVHNNTVYLAGQVAADASAGVKGQTEQVLKKIDDLLKAAGTDKSKLLSATIFLADIRGFDEMNAAWDAWVVAGSTPGRATVEARLANSKSSSRSSPSPRSDRRSRSSECPFSACPTRASTRSSRVRRSRRKIRARAR